MSIPKNEPKSILMSFKFSPSEKRLLERLAKEKGVTKTQLLRIGMQLLSFSLFDDPAPKDGTEGGVPKDE